MLLARTVNMSETTAVPGLTQKIQGGPKNRIIFKTLLYNNIGRRSICQNVQLFIRSKTDILNAAVFKILCIR